MGVVALLAAGISVLAYVIYEFEKRAELISREQAAREILGRQVTFKHLPVIVEFDRPAGDA